MEKSFADLVKERDHLKNQHDINQKQLNELNQKQRAKSREVRDQMKEIRSINKSIRAISEIEAYKAISPYLINGRDVETICLAMNHVIRQYMNKRNKLTVFDFIALNLADSRPWNHGLSRDKNGVILEHQSRCSLVAYVRVALVKGLSYYLYEQVGIKDLIDRESIQSCIFRNTEFLELIRSLSIEVDIDKEQR